MNFQTDTFIHSIDIGINKLYFSELISYTDYGYSFFSKYSKIKKKHVVYEGKQIPEFLDGEIILSSKQKSFVKSCEILYTIPEIFSRENYKNRKKYQNCILTPKTLAKKMNLTLRSATWDDLYKIENLHNAWVEKKLSDPRVHQITFSKKRYINCVKHALDKDNFHVYVAECDGELMGVRVISENRERVLFDAAFFVKFWEKSQLSEAINIAILHDLNERGYVYFNTGISSGSLKKYKQQLPNIEVFVYRKNQKSVNSTLDVL